MNPQDRVEQAVVWLEQARLDHTALQRLFSQSNPPEPSRLPRTPEGAVYLLQQTVEKAVKSLLIAAGYDATTLSKQPYRHDSLTAILEVYRRQFDVPGLSQAFDVIAQSQPLGVDGATQALETIENIREMVKRGGTKELAVLPPEVVQSWVECMQGLRQLSVDRVHTSLRSWTDLKVDASEAKGSAPVDQILSIAMDTMQNSIPADQLEVVKKSLEEMLFPSGPQPAQALEDADGQRLIQADDLLRNLFLPAWGLTSLCLLAALTFPHGASTRYPAPWGAPDEPAEAAERGMLGTKHYTAKLGVVAHLESLTSVTELVLQDMEPLLEYVSGLQEAAVDDSTE